MGVPVEELVSTPIEDITPAYEAVRNTFFTHKTKPLEFRLLQLRQLYWAITDNTEALLEALSKDLNKPRFEALCGEIEWCRNDCVFAQNNLRKWAQDESAPDIPLTSKPLAPKIRKDPLGCVLVIGAFNFPLQLSIGPFIGAIAGGNTAILKPSELSSHTAMVMQRMIEDYLDPSAYRVIQGAIPETTALLDLKWDKIFYTGGIRVAKIIAKKAAETLTPVALELGGKNPAIVTKNADLHLAARRLLWAKSMNAGQVCISQNYTMIDQSVLPAFINELKAAMKTFYPNGLRNSPDFARIVDSRNYDRITGMLDASKGKILMGGERDEKERYLELTVVQIDNKDDALVADETFGPIVTVLPVSDLDQAIQIANEVSVTPLGIYPFGTNAETARVLDETRSGGASINDGMFHGCQPTLAFGGVGESGQGSYRGKASFECFTHRRSVVKTPSWIEGLLDIRYPPFSEKNTKKFQSMSVLKPNFNREGRPTGLAWVLSFLGY
ncbi:MAG: hypothetical protein M1814_001193 [Vezdaea aestivalis]|nr:MAG: hypothetical protein M1814_001193 [Vezdaea aestivalis]